MTSERLLEQLVESTDFSFASLTIALYVSLKGAPNRGLLATLRTPSGVVELYGSTCEEGPCWDFRKGEKSVPTRDLWLCLRGRASL